MKTTKYMFFSIVLLVSGLAMTAIRLEAAPAGEQPSLQAEILLVPQDVVAQLSFNSSNAFRKGERVAVQSDTQPEKYEYRVIRGVGRAVDAMRQDAWKAFYEDGKPVNARYFQLQDDPAILAHKPEKLGKLPGQELAVAPSAPVEQVLEAELTMPQPQTFPFPEDNPLTGAIVPPEVKTRLSFSDTNLFRLGELVALQTGEGYKYATVNGIAGQDLYDPKLVSDFQHKGSPINVNEFSLAIKDPNGNELWRGFFIEKIGKITAYNIGDLVPEWLQKLEQFAFDEKNTTIPNGEMVMVRRSDGTLRFGRVVHKADLRGEALYEVLVDGQTGASKTLPAKQVGRITHYL